MALDAEVAREGLVGVGHGGDVGMLVAVEGQVGADGGGLPGVQQLDGPLPVRALGVPEDVRRPGDAETVRWRRVIRKGRGGGRGGGGGAGIH